MSLHLRYLPGFNVPEPRDPPAAALTLPVPLRTGIYCSHCSVPIFRSETWSVSFCGLSPYCNDKCVRSCAERPLMKVGYGAGICEVHTKRTYIAMHGVQYSSSPNPTLHAIRPLLILQSTFAMAPKMQYGVYDRCYFSSIH